MPLVRGCTKEELYRMLEALGEDTAALRKKDATFSKLEALYYKRFDKKLKEFHEHHLKETSPV